jgi:hypothetical protein
MTEESTAQQSPSICIGGHFTEPYEQKTQQSPRLGFNAAPHVAQS